MTTVFIAGSISISRLHAKVQERIHKIVSSNFNVVVGDADGADSSIQECLRNYQAKNVTVYCTGEIQEIISPIGQYIGFSQKQKLEAEPILQQKT